MSRPAGQVQAGSSHAASSNEPSEQHLPHLRLCLVLEQHVVRELVPVHRAISIGIDLLLTITHRRLPTPIHDGTRLHEEMPRLFFFHAVEPEDLQSTSAVQWVPGLRCQRQVDPLKLCPSPQSQFRCRRRRRRHRSFLRSSLPCPCHCRLDC